MPKSCRLSAAAALLLGLLAAAPAWAVTYGEIEVKAFGEPKGHTSHGYTEYRFSVRHAGEDGTRDVRLALPGNDDAMRGGRIQSVARSFKIEAGKTMYVSLLVPAAPSAYGSGVWVWIDGRKQEDRVPLSIATGVYTSGPRRGMMGTTQLILYSQRVPENFFAPVAGGAGVAGAGAWVMPGPGRGGPAVKKPAGAPPAPPAPGEAEPPPIEMVEPGIGIDPEPRVGIVSLPGEQVRADTPISIWSRDWLAYSRYDGIVVTVEDLAELGRGGNETQTILRALHQYAETGGVLFVLGPGKVELPASWSRQTWRETTGWVFDGGATIHVAGFGRCIMLPDRDTAKWKQERWSIFVNECGATGRPFGDNHSMSDLNQSLAPVDDLGVPVKGLFVLMCLFAAVIGPGNVWLLSRWNRRIWLLWTVPAVSSLTCLAVFGYMVIAEGWHGHARVTGFTVLDETQKRATTVGRTSFYSPLTPSEGLRFDSETEASVVGAHTMDYRRYGGMEQSSLGSCAVDWTDGQHFARGWVSARVPAHFLLRKSKTQQERLMVHRDGDALVMVNGLGAPIKTITLADEKGQLHTASDVAEGAKVVMKPAGTTVKGLPQALRSQVYSSTDWAMAVRSAPGKQNELLMPRSYLAVVEGSPFLEQGLKGARVRQTESVVLGLMADLQ